MNDAKDEEQEKERGDQSKLTSTGGSKIRRNSKNVIQSFAQSLHGSRASKLTCEHLNRAVISTRCPLFPCGLIYPKTLLGLYGGVVLICSKTTCLGAIHY